MYFYAKLFVMVLKKETSENFEDVKKIFIAYLEQHQHRKTPERFTILKEIYAFVGHFDVETLYLQMKNNKYRVSRATLYNTIELLLLSGLVVKHQFGQNCAHYEKSFKFKQHDHLICVDTKKVMEFCDPRLQEIQKSLEKMFDVTITHHALTFYATCKQSKEKK